MSVVLLIASSMNAGVQNMILSLQKMNWNYAVVGLGVKWEGFKTKLELIAQFCASQDPQTIICMVDAYDALCVRDNHDFVEEFNKMGMDIICTGESVCLGNCLPLNAYWATRELTTQNQYINSGIVIGKAFAMAHMYQHVLTYGINDDQLAVCTYVLEFADEKPILVDQHNQFGLNVYSMDIMGTIPNTFYEWDSSNQLKNKANSFHPYFVHFPGFLTYPSVPLLNLTPPKLEHYEDVGKHILGDQLLNIHQVNQGTYLVGSATWIAIISLLCVLIFVGIILLAVQHRKYKQLLKTKRIKS